LIDELGAEIFPGPEAEKYGYVDDGNANYSKALETLLSLSKVNANESYQVVTMTPKKNFVEELFGSSAIFKGIVKHEISVQKKTSDCCSYLYEPQM